MLLCDTCFGVKEESCAPNTDRFEADAVRDICEDDDAERGSFEAACEGVPENKCRYSPGAPMVCQARMSDLVGSARGDGEAPCTEQLEEQMSSEQLEEQISSVFAGANVRVSQA